ncbi:DUF6042 family protein [Streptomyces canus]|uniref:DUF6042 family protein n=1 Tax=Streptomyces canus TaxID=58343 RepID=UPI0033E3073F
MTAVSLPDGSQDQHERIHSVIGGGWLRVPPPMTGLLLMALASRREPVTREDLRPFLRNSANPSGDWQASCWDDGHERDAEELADLEAARTTAARYATHYELPPVCTLSDMLTLLIAAGLVRELPGADGQLRLAAAFPLPGPHEVFPLDAEEQAAQDWLRRHNAYHGDAAGIIALFDPSGVRRQEITTSLDRLARVIDGHPHDAREAVRLLLEQQDFTTAADISALPSHKVFRLRCDWPRFDAHRMRVRRGRKGQLSVTTAAERGDSA